MFQYKYETFDMKFKLVQELKIFSLLKWGKYFSITILSTK